jgi:triosephosphate isomerase
MSRNGSGRRVLVSGNWKMHHTHYEAIQVVQKLAALLRAAPLPDGTDVSLHPVGAENPIQAIDLGILCRGIGGHDRHRQAVRTIQSRPTCIPTWVLPGK